MARQWDDKISTATVAIPSDNTISPPFSPPSATLTTVRRVNKDGTFVYIKYHFLANNGEKQLSADEALRFGGQHLDFSNHDFWQTTKRAGRYLGRRMCKLWSRRQIRGNWVSTRSMLRMFGRRSCFQCIPYFYSEVYRVMANWFEYSCTNLASRIWTRPPKITIEMLNKPPFHQEAWSPESKTALVPSWNSGCSFTATHSTTESV